MHVRRALAFGLGLATAVALVGVPAPVWAAPPTITVQPTVEASPAGGNIELTVGATAPGGGSLNYQWLYELIKGSGVWLPVPNSLLGVGVSGANTDTLKLNGVLTALNAIGLKVQVTAAGESATSDPVGVVVGDPPTIGAVAQVESRAVSGGDVHLTATAAGASPLVYSWQVLKPAALLSRWTSLTNGSGVSGARTATLALSNLTADVAKNSYRLVVTNPVGVDISDPVKIDVGVAPTVTNPVDAAAAGGSATFNSTIAGNPVPSVKWQKRASVNDAWVDLTSDAGTVSLADNVSTVKLGKLTTSDNGSQVRVVASNSFNETATSQPATITVAGSKPTITDPANIITLGVGNLLSVNVTGDPAPAVTWQRKSPASGSSWEDRLGRRYAGADRCVDLARLDAAVRADVGVERLQVPGRGPQRGGHRGVGFLDAGGRAAADGDEPGRQDGIRRGRVDLGERDG